MIVQALGSSEWQSGSNIHILPAVLAIRQYCGGLEQSIRMRHMVS